MLSSTHKQHVRSAAVGVAGPMAVGAVLGMPFGVWEALTLAATIPAIVLGVAALMTPALYVGLSLVGAAPPAARLATTLLGSLRAMGIALLGLAPASLFLVTNSNQELVLLFVVTMGLLVGVFMAARALLVGFELKLAQWWRALPVLAVWVPVTLTLGAFFYLQTLHGILD